MKVELRVIYIEFQNIGEKKFRLIVDFIAFPSIKKIEEGDGGLT